MKRKMKCVGIAVSVFITLALFATLSQAKVINGMSIGGNRDFVGGDYDQFHVKTLEECIHRCAEDQRCKAFAFAESAQACALKDKVGEKVKAPGMKSGRKL